MIKYHNRLNIRYAKKCVYFVALKEVFGIDFKNNPQQCNMILDSLNAHIDTLDVVASKKYIPKEQQVTKMLGIIEPYLKKYKNKIQNCLDTNCLDIYERLETIKEELDEMIILEKQRKERNEKGSKLNLKSIKSRLELFTIMLNLVEFDKQYDCKGVTYERQVNERIPKKYCCKLYNDDEIKDRSLFNNNQLIDYNYSFIDNYYNQTGINLNEDKKQKDYIFSIHRKIAGLNNAFVDYYTNNDITTLNIECLSVNNFIHKDNSFIQDITYKNLCNKLTNIIEYITNNQLDMAFVKIKEIIKFYKSLYESVS